MPCKFFSWLPDNCLGEQEKKPGCPTKTILMHAERQSDRRGTRYSNQSPSRAPRRPPLQPRVHCLGTPGVTSASRLSNLLSACSLLSQGSIIIKDTARDHGPCAHGKRPSVRSDPVSCSARAARTIDFNLTHSVLKHLVR